jgi:hypothetical protein
LAISRLLATVVETSSNQQDWPDELDALSAAPQYHALLFENEAVRVLDTRVPRDKRFLSTRTHGQAFFYILSCGDFVRRDGEAATVVDGRITGKKIPQGSALWSEPLPPHTLENVGGSELRAN